jgi:hypothetical protein
MALLCNRKWEVLIFLTTMTGQEKSWKNSNNKRRAFVLTAMRCCCCCCCYCCGTEGKQSGHKLPLEAGSHVARRQDAHCRLLTYVQ